MRFGSVCSGIEAASVAWEPLGRSAAWFAEVDAFPSAVLDHHWPHVPNMGDMTALADWVAAGRIEAPDVLVGGTPCQAFSVAGSRDSLDDARGQLSLEFCRLADAIDGVRNEKAIIVWENVPGVLSTKDNAFGCFLGELSGAGGSSCLQGENGQTVVLLLDRKDKSLGESSTPNFSEWPNDAAVCLLSQVLEMDSIHPKYYLSSKACAGILRRAESRGKTLPEALEVALRTQAATE